MGCCGGDKTTGDPETDERQNFVKELQDGIKNFNASIKMTMDAYRNLLNTLERISDSYNTVASRCSEYVRKPVGDFREGMRDLKEKGGFVEFDRAIHSDTVEKMEPITALLKDTQKSLDELRSKNHKYQSHSDKVTKMEQSYAKKGKSVSGSSGYEKECKKRDESKAEYEKKKQQFTSQVERMKQDIDHTLLSSMNNYLRSTATFCGYIENVMNGYRTDGMTGADTPLDRLKRQAATDGEARRRKYATTYSTASREVIKGQSSTIDKSRADEEPNDDVVQDTPNPFTA